MCLLDLQLCHFVVYESNNNTCAIVVVPRDEKFILDLVVTLSTCYFTHILPWLTERHKEKNEKENI